MNMDFEIIKNFGSAKEVALTQHKMIHLLQECKYYVRSERKMLFLNAKHEEYIFQRLSFFS